MKIKKIFSALLASAMVFGMSALAADVKFDDTVTYTAGAETVTLNVYAGSNVTTMDGYSILSITFDESVFSVQSATTTQESATATDNGDGTISWCNETTAVTTITSDPLMTVVFNVLDPSKVVGSTFGIDEGNSGLFADEGNTAYDFSGVSVTVTAAGPVGPTATKVGETSSKGVTAYTVSTLADQKVMMSQKFTQQVIKPETRVLITYNGETREFGSDLYDKLGGQGGGEVTIGSLTFGLLVDGNATADQFSFEIK